MPETPPNPAPNVIVRPSTVEQAQIAVHSEADLVCLTIGNSTIKMGYETAFKLSQWLRVRAKEAKKFAGDTGRHWSLLATLEGLKI
jgi:hypothetical protein